MSRAPDPGTMLLHALLASAAAAGVAIDVTHADWMGWASATFRGARHEIAIAAAGGLAFETWLAGLPEREFTLRGQLVADLAVVRVHRAAGRVTAVIEILTVEED